MPTIAELILEQGRQQANERQRQGDIRGSMWQNLANIAAQYGKNVREQQIEAPIRQQEAKLRGLQIQQGQGELADKAAARAHDAAFRDAIVRGVPDEDLVKIDPERADKFIAGRDAVVKAKQQGYTDRQRILMDSTLGLEAVPDELRPSAYAQKRAELVQHQIIKPEDAPEQFDPAWFSSTLAHAHKLNEKTEADIGKTRAETLKLQAETSGTMPLTPAQQELTRHNKETERIQGLQVGRADAAQRETERHNKAMEAANNPLAALTGGAAPRSAAQAEGAHGDDFLKTLPPQVASEVKAYAEGRRPFPAGFALKAPYFQSLIQMVGQYDPTFDAVNYNARSKTRNDFTSGKSAQTINALNTVTQHLDRLSDAADALNNSSLPTFNSIANLVSKATGNKQVTNFETTKKAVVDELTRAWRGAGGSEGDIKSWSQVLDASESPAQLHGAIAEMGQLLEGKLSALQAQYGQGMGTTDTTGMQVVTPQARQTLDKLESRSSGGSKTSGPSEGTKGNVNGRAATWRTVNGKTGWYAD